MSELYKNNKGIMGNEIFMDVISPDAINFFAENSSLGFFKHDVLRGSFFFSKKSLNDMSLPAESDLFKENEVKDLWGEELYSNYTQNILSNFTLKNYKYSLVYDTSLNGKMISLKLCITLTANERGELAFVEVLTLDHIPEKKNSLLHSAFGVDDFRNILNNLNSLVFLVDHDYNIVDYNYVGEEVFSIPISKYVDKEPLSNFFSFDELKLNEIFSKNIPLLSCRSRLLVVKSGVRNFVFNVVRVDNINDESYLLFSGVDISDSIRLEEHLKINALKFKSIFEQSPVGINIYDRNASLIDSNSAALEIMSIPNKKDMLGFNLYDCLELTSEEMELIDRGDDLSISKLFDFSHLSHEFDFNTNYTGKKYIEVNISKIHSRNTNNDFGYLEILTDKSKQYADSESLRKKSEQLIMATKAGNIGIFEMNLFSDDNDSFTESFTTEFFDQDTSFTDFFNKVHPADVDKLIEEEFSLRTGRKKEFTLEYRIKDVDEEWKWVKTNAFISNDSSADGIPKLMGTTVDIDRIKKAEQKALDRENLLHMTLNVGKIGLWEYNVIRDEIRLENYIVDTLNLGHVSFGNTVFGVKKFLSIIYDDDRGDVLKSYSNLLYGNVDSITVEFRLTETYSNKWVRMTAFVSKRDEHGKSVGMNGFIMNINDKTVALENSRRVQYLLENSLKISNIGYFYKYYNEDKIEVSDTCCKIFDLSCEEVTNLEVFITKRIHHDDESKYRMFIDSFVEEKTDVLKKINYRIIIDGEIRRITEYARLYFDEKGKRKGTLYAAQDVTDVYESEVMLRELLDNQRLVSEISFLMMKNIPSEQLTDSIIDNIRIRLKAKCVSFYLKEENSYYLKNCSSSFSCSFSVDIKQIEASELEYVEKQLLRNNPILLTSAAPLNFKTKEKQNAVFIDNCSSLFLPIFIEGNYHGFLLINIDEEKSKISGNDISLMHSFIQMINLAFEKIYTQTELIKAKDKAEESDRLKTSFLKNMSHEIRTPLNSIVGFAGIIAESIGNSDDEIKEYSNVLSRNTDQLLDIVNNVIDYSEIESTVLSVFPQLINLFDVCTEIHERTKPRVQDDVDFVLSDSDPSIVVNVDPVRLKQVLVNLVNNAVKYTEKGEVRFGFNKRSNGVQFFVFDSGIGISDERKEEIFECFYQEDRMSVGIGLGLSIVKAILDKINGELWFESEEGVGSKFYFFIPNCIQ